MASFSAGTTFTDGVANDVTAAKLAALVNAATPTSGLIQDRTAEFTIAADDTLLFGDFSDSSNLKRMTVANFAGTLPTATITTLNSTTGTITTLNSTTGTIPTLVATTLVTTGTGTAAAPAIVPTGDTNTGIFFPAADTIAFSEGGAEAMRIDSSGNVGIGTNSPLFSAGFTSLTLNGTTSGILEIKSNGTQKGAFFNDGSLTRLRSSGTLAFDANNTEAMRIDSSGNVGIGTTSPQTPLHVKSSSNTEILRLQSAHNTGQALITYHKSNGTRKAYIGYGSSVNEQFFIANEENGPISFDTFGTERLRIDSSGNLLVGCTASPSSSVSGLLLQNPINSASSFSLGTYTGGATVISFINGNGAVGSISVSGSATAYNTSSDYRLKTNLEPISNGIDRVKQLPVYRFNWIADQSGNKVDGFVAHEAQAIVPECVTGEKDAVDADGKPIHQGIDQSKIVPLLTAALKEAITKIETLEAKVTALEAA